ncbi:MAG: polyketide synthase dehydratase domain-containing protein [Chloroflexi bacterium]|nr:polyketide synthase dehydratase domain-containing protein [Chloroflexota bacterium]
MITTSSPDLQLTLQLDTRSLPYLADHKIGGLQALPASAYLEMVLAAGLSASKGRPCRVEDVQLHELLLFNDQAARTVRITLASNTDDAWLFSIESLRSSGSDWAMHANGVLRCDAPPAAPAPILHSEILARCGEQLRATDHYAAMQARGLHYGPAFKAVEVIWRRDGEAFAQLRLPAALETDAQLYNIHPVLLDAAIQSVAAARPGESGTSLPVALGRLVVYERRRVRLWSHVVVGAESQDGGFSADVTLLDEAGKVVATLHGLRIQPAATAHSAAAPTVATAPAVAAAAPVVSNGELAHAALEQLLTRTWKDVLGLRELERSDRFFDLGGDSITATQIADKIGRAGIVVSPKDILETQTITKLMLVINARKEQTS